MELTTRTGSLQQGKELAGVPSFLAGIGHGELQQGFLSARGIYLVKDEAL